MNHVTLITGGSSGIGAAAAEQLLDQGHRVAVTGRDRDRLAEFARSLGRPAGLLTLAGDASDHDAMRSAVETTVKEFGRLDAVVEIRRPSGVDVNTVVVRPLGQPV